MHRYLNQSLLAVLACYGMAQNGFAEPSIGFVRTDGSLAIQVDGRPLATYVWVDPDILRPYFARLHAPDGTQVTRNLPPLAGDATDHATMHPGLSLAFGDLSGGDFWRNKGRVAVELAQEPIAQAGEASFAVRNRYLMGDNLICNELCRVGIRVQPAAYLLTWDSRFSGDSDFFFGDQEEMGLGVRLATGLTVKSGGQITNSEGLKNEKQVWGRVADWCDYSGTVDGQSVGILLMPDPDNFRRSWFHARDYGLLVANPFGAKAFTKGPLSKIVVPKGQTLRLRWGVLLHAGPVDLAAAYKDWVLSLKATQ
jgi:hypothetical protein